MRATLLGFVTIAAALGLLVGAILFYIAAKIALAALLFLLFAGIVVWAVIRYAQGRTSSDAGA